MFSTICLRTPRKIRRYYSLKGQYRDYYYTFFGGVLTQIVFGGMRSGCSLGSSRYNQGCPSLPVYRFTGAVQGLEFRVSGLGFPRLLRGTSSVLLSHGCGRGRVEVEGSYMGFTRYLPDKISRNLEFRCASECRKSQNSHLPPTSGKTQLRAPQLASSFMLVRG